MRQSHGRHRTRARALGGLVTAMLAVALSACSGASPQDPPVPTEEPEAPPVTPMQEDLIGTWSSDEPGNPQLTFADDSTVQGTDGCNGISTTYEIEGNRVTVEPFASTLKACAGIDDWLRSVSVVTIEGDLMLVHNDAGDELGTLEREQE